MAIQETDRKIPVRLRVVNEEGFEKTIIHERGLLRVGSDPGSDLRLNHASVAPCHLLILRDGSRHAFTDGGSGKSISVNGRDAASGYLRHKDVIKLGDSPYTITFLTEGERADDRQEMNLRKLLETSKAINSSLVLDEVLQHVMDYTMEVTRAAKGFLMLVEPDGKLKARVARNIDLAALEGEVIPASRTVIQQVMETGRPVFIIGGGEDAGSVSLSSSSSIMRLQLKTIMCAPLVSREGSIGVVYVDHHNKVENVTKTDLEILESLAGLATVAIENARLTEQMLQAERVSAIGRMVSSIVHDLRAPLTAIRGAAQLLKMNPTEEKVSRTTEIVLGQVDRMTAMTEEVLDFCRGKTSLGAARCTLSSFLAQVAGSLREEMTARSVELILDAQDGAAVNIDLRKMERVFRNLCENAAHAMPEGGSLRIATSLDDGRVVVRLIDTGHGMSEDVRRRAFEPFFTEGKRNGSGLGMAISRRILEAHGGEIDIESTSSSGTTIRIALPVASTHELVAT
jgi:K+-sensing histidine kinase KdpD